MWLPDERRCDLLSTASSFSRAQLRPLAVGDPNKRPSAVEKSNMRPLAVDESNIDELSNDEPNIDESNKRPLAVDQPHKDEFNKRPPSSLRSDPGRSRPIRSMYARRVSVRKRRRHSAFVMMRTVVNPPSALCPSGIIRRDVCRPSPLVIQSPATMTDAGVDVVSHVRFSSSKAMSAFSDHVCLRAVIGSSGGYRPPAVARLPPLVPPVFEKNRMGGGGGSDQSEREGTRRSCFRPLAMTSANLDRHRLSSRGRPSSLRQSRLFRAPLLVRSPCGRQTRALKAVQLCLRRQRAPVDSPAAEDDSVWSSCASTAVVAAAAAAFAPLPSSDLIDDLSLTVPTDKRKMSRRPAQGHRRKDGSGVVLVVVDSERRKAKNGDGLPACTCAAVASPIPSLRQQSTGGGGQRRRQSPLSVTPHRRSMQQCCWPSIGHIFNQLAFLSLLRPPGQRRTQTRPFGLNFGGGGVLTAEGDRSGGTGRGGAGGVVGGGGRCDAAAAAWNSIRPLLVGRRAPMLISHNRPACSGGTGRGSGRLLWDARVGHFLAASATRCALTNSSSACRFYCSSRLRRRLCLFRYQPTQCSLVQQPEQAVI
uniref:Uncharacterized protein n=1 Tax=Plectus sambesii TaxID=2011161 RepID=A0A914WRM0_9BILA